MQACSRADLPPRPDMAEFLGKEAEPGWKPDYLFVTQTANLQPATFDAATQVDFYGFGLDVGDSNETGLWGRTGPIR
ncbi:hypothetical protein GCM10029992_44210 [Glycomyces albus]